MMVCKVEEPNFIEVSYITSSGANANGLQNFTFLEDL